MARQSTVSRIELSTDLDIARGEYDCHRSHVTSVQKSFFFTAKGDPAGDDTFSVYADLHRSTGDRGSYGSQWQWAAFGRGRAARYTDDVHVALAQEVDRLTCK